MNNSMRIKIEKAISHKLVDSLLEFGYKLGVNDGEETTVKNSNDPEEIKNALWTTDEDYILVYQNDKRIGYVFLVYGNCQDLISDYTINLELPVNAIVEDIEESNLIFN